MTQVIEGLKITLLSGELSDHLSEKAKFHGDKALWYRDQVASLREGDVGETHHSNDPVSSLKRSETEHRRKASYFMFLAAHVIADAEYLLSERDLAAIEITERII